MYIEAKKAPICRPVASGGAGGALAPLVFERPVNPNSSRGAHYPHPVLQAPQIFRPCDGPDK